MSVNDSLFKFINHPNLSAIPLDLLDFFIQQKSESKHADSSIHTHYYVPKSLEVLYSTPEISYVVEILQNIVAKKCNCFAVLRQGISYEAYAWALGRARDFLVAVAHTPSILDTPSHLKEFQGLLHADNSVVLAPKTATELELQGENTKYYPAEGNYIYRLTIDGSPALDCMKHLKPKIEKIWADITLFRLDFSSFLVGFFDQILNVFPKKYYNILLPIPAEDNTSSFTSFAQEHNVVDFICFLLVFGGCIQHTGIHYNRILYEGITTRLRIILHSLGVYPSSLFHSSSWNEMEIYYYGPSNYVYPDLGLGAWKEGVMHLLHDLDSSSYFSKLITCIYTSQPLSWWKKYQEVSNIVDDLHPIVKSTFPSEDYSALFDLPNSFINIDNTLSLCLDLKLSDKTFKTVDAPTLVDVIRQVTPLAQGIRYANNITDGGYNEICILNDYLCVTGYSSDLKNTILAVRKNKVSRIQDITVSKLDYTSSARFMLYTKVPPMNCTTHIQGTIPEKIHDDFKEYIKFDIMNYLRFRFSNTTEEYFFTTLASLHYREINGSFYVKISTVRSSIAEYLKGKTVQDYLQIMLEKSLPINSKSHDYSTSLLAKKQFSKEDIKELVTLLYNSVFLNENPVVKLEPLTSNFPFVQNLLYNLISISNLLTTYYSLSAEAYTAAYIKEISKIFKYSTWSFEYFKVIDYCLSSAVCSKDNSFNIETQKMNSKFLLVIPEQLHSILVHSTPSNYTDSSTSPVFTFADPSIKYDPATVKGQAYARLTPKPGKRPKYLIFKLDPLPGIQLSTYHFMFIAKHQGILKIHITGNVMNTLIDICANNNLDTLMEQANIFSTGFLFLPYHVFMQYADYFTPVLSPAIDYSFLLKLLKEANKIATEAWNVVSQNDTVYVDVDGSKIVGFFSLIDFLRIYQDHIHFSAKDTLMRFHCISLEDLNTTICLESPIPVKGKVKRKSRKVESHFIERNTNKALFTNTYISPDAEDLILRYARPGMSIREKRALQIACGYIKWSIMLKTSTKLTKNLLDNGVYDIGELPVFNCTHEVRNKLKENIRTIYQLGGLRSEFPTVEKAIEYYSSYTYHKRPLLPKELLDAAPESPL